MLAYFCHCTAEDCHECHELTSYEQRKTLCPFAFFLQHEHCRLDRTFNNSKAYLNSYSMLKIDVLQRSQHRDGWAAISVTSSFRTYGHQLNLLDLNSMWLSCGKDQQTYR